MDLWPMWEAIECPAVIVRGEESDVLPASTARRMLARQPRANLVEIPGVAHGIPYARPGELAVVIEELAKAVAE
ncbi:MAG: alpha/beta hydrolase [Dehalococcoidia bacterium]